MTERESYLRPQESLPTGTVLSPKADPSLVVPGLEHDDRVFNVRYHEEEIHVPIPVLDVTNDEGVHSLLPDCLDMPIRMKGESDYHVPDDWKALAPVIQQIIDLEASNNSHWREYYTYLSVHYTPELTPGEQQRHAGCHTDGFQGAREPVRTLTSRSYVGVTNGGTRYFPQTFVAALDPAKFNVFEGFDLQVRKDADGNPVFGIANDNTFYFFDAYTVHESGAADRPGSRAFIRLTWEMKLFDRAINTKNRMLDYDWEPVEYDIRSDLLTPTLEDIEKARIVR